MCKIAIFPHIKSENQENAMKLARALTPLMTERDDDGFGYAALGSHGLFGERWLDPADAWSSPAMSLKIQASIGKRFKGAFKALEDRNSFGSHSSRVFSLILHSRMATCGIGIENTHPFVSRDGLTALIHNGVISNADAFPGRVSTCDSEALLVRYESENVGANFKALQQALTPLTGWYAAAAFSRNAKGAPILDLFKDARTPLFSVFIKELDEVVFCTSLDFLIKACKRLKFTIEASFEVSDCSALRFNPLTGELISQSELIPPANVYPATSALNFSSINDDDAAYDNAEWDAYADESPLSLDEIMRNPHGISVKRGA